MKIKKRNVKWIVLALALLILLGYFAFKQSEEESVIEAIKNSKAVSLSSTDMQSANTAENLVLKEAKGGLVPESAPIEYKRDEQRFTLIRSIRISLADYYDKNSHYPVSLDSLALGDNIYIKDITYNVRNANGYNLIMKFETSEAVLVGANVEYQNKNAYDLSKKIVTFTEKSGNFFYFTAATAKAN